MKAVVSKPICPLFSQPDAQSERVDEALSGWVLDLGEEAAPGWYPARTHYGYTGFVAAGSLALGAGSAERWTQREKQVLDMGIADVLGRPSIQSPVLTTLLRGSLVAPLDQPNEEGWQRAALPGGLEGYLREGFLAPYCQTPCPDEEGALRRAVADTALSYLGTQYRWGGKTPMGIDCSGLVFMSYFMHGVLIFRDSRIEPGYPVHEIALEDIQTGDLLYFPGHVALYLGDGRYIHATARSGDDRVVINSLNPSDQNFRADLPQQLTAAGSIF